MGAHLSCFGNRPAMWKEALVRLRGARSLGPGQENLFSRLRISYDLLEESEQQLFLDAAFFFLGREADTVRCVWTGCALQSCYGVPVPPSQTATPVNTFMTRYPCNVADQCLPFPGQVIVALLSSRMSKTVETDFYTLESCCLLHITPDDTMSMHDQLRDLAYAIVRDEGDILQRSRWRIQDAVEVHEEVQPLVACASLYIICLCVTCHDLK